MSEDLPVHPIVALSERGRRHLPEFIGLDEAAATDGSLGRRLGFRCKFYDADNPGGQILPFNASQLRLFLRDGKVVFGSVG